MTKDFLLKLGIVIYGLFSSTMACSEGIKTVRMSYDLVENQNITSKVVIDLTKRGQTVDKSFYGTHLDSFNKTPEGSLIKELGVGQIRVGGNEFDVFNWKTSNVITKTGLHNVIGFPQISAFLKYYQLGGIFQVNIQGFQPEPEGSSFVLKNTFSPYAAYEMIKTLNGAMKLNIVNVSLGNEFDQWHETHPHTKAWSTDSGISADEYINRYIEYALAIRQAQEEVTGDPNSIKIWGPEIASPWLDWNTGNFTRDCKWSDIPGQVTCSYGDGKFTHFIPYFLDRLAKAEASRFLNPKRYKLLDYFAFHYYPNFRKKISDINSIITDPEGRQWVSKMLESARLLHDPTYTNTVDLSSFKNMNPNIIGRMKNWVNTYYPKAKLAINEFAVDSDYRTTNYHPIVRPLYVADTLGISTKEGISFFNNFILSSKPGSNIPWALIAEGNQRTNAFYTYALFTNHFKGTVVQADDNMGDIVNAYATDTGSLINLALINKSPSNKTVQIYIANGSNRKVATYDIPGWSTSIVKLEKSSWSQSGTFEVNQFGAEEMGIPKDLNYSKY